MSFELGARLYGNALAGPDDLACGRIGFRQMAGLIGEYANLEVRRARWVDATGRWPAGSIPDR